VSLRVAVVGCGLIGRKRAEALGEDRLVACYDRDRALAEALGPACADLAELLALQPDAVVVAVTPDALADVACQALAAGAHVLVEKPGGRSGADIARIAQAAVRTGRLAQIGFNHRYHPAIARALAAARSGEHGPVLFVRARYGHGGRRGYEREWRFDPAVSGGGELVDQGMHLLDLCYAALGPLPLRSALLRNSFWDGVVEDNAAVLLGEPGRNGPWATLHASWSEWKNLFSLEITCRSAKLQVDGLAGSYGPQRLTIYTMRPELGPPDVEEVEFDPEDVSWLGEWDAFRAAIAAGEPSDLRSAEWAWSIVEEAYAREEAA
jgi:predicted dehydrogenase